MAEQQKKTPQQKPVNDTRSPNPDDPRHAPESGEPKETTGSDRRGAHGNHAGDRDESGRLGPTK